MKLKKWMSIAAAVCLAVTAVPMQAAAQAEFAQEMLAESREEPQEEPVEEIVEESKEEPQEELKEEPVEEGKEELQEQPAAEIEPQGEEVSLLTGEENGIVVLENENTAPFAGEGTAESPYLIQNADDLKTLAQKVNSGTDYANTYFKQTADIDLENKEWTPIGIQVLEEGSGLFRSKNFKGTFDGDKHQITNLKRTRSTTGSNDYVGLFGLLDGATIQNCNVTGEVNGYNYVGGIVGETGTNTKIKNCSFRGNVTATGEYVGGTTGAMASGCEVSGCFVTGTVKGVNRIGGIAGNGVGEIKNCYVLADVSAAGNYAGGIAGYAFALKNMENCYYSGEVSASNYAGGIAGGTMNTTVKNCVSLAEKVSGSSASRIVGWYYTGSNAENNYAWSGTEIDNKNDGADLTYENGTLSPQFSTIFDNTDSVWEFTEDGLPILKGVSGAQSVFLPSYIRGTKFQGTGNTAEDPYLIRNVNDLKLLSDKVNGGETYEGKYFKQTADINLNDTAWTPIGTNTKPFKGTFDGGGYKIIDLKVTGNSNNAGLFGYTQDATIQNCNVTGKVKGNNDVGGIVGNADGKTQILSCSFRGAVTGEVAYIGGIAGNACGTIKNCYALADVTASFADAGGIAGSASSVTIENCYYSGKVSAESCTGGIAGFIFGSTTIKNCVSLAESVKGMGSVDYINRIVGYVGSNANVTLTNNYGYNRTKLVVNGEKGYANTTDAKQGTTVFVSKGKVMTDVPSNTLFDWEANGFTTANGWSIPTEAGKLPSLREGEYPKLPTLPSKDLTIDETPQHFTTRNIGEGFVVKVTSEGTLNENIKFTKEYRLHDTNDTWTSDVPRTAGTYDVKITRDADGDINPFVCEISEGLVLRKKHSSSGSTATPTYTAQFDTNGGSAVSKAKTDETGKIEKPADPTKEGYLFAGWYSDSKLTKRFDFSTALTADTTLYAKWSENNEIILTIGSKTVSVFGSEIENDVAPKIVNDRTMLPIRIVAENLGGTVTWNGELQRVTLQKGADVILITIGTDTAYVNGAAVQLDAAAFVENGRTYLPLRFVSENLGAQVAWNETEKTVTITK